MTWKHAGDAPKDLDSTAVITEGGTIGYADRKEGLWLFFSHPGRSEGGIAGDVKWYLGPEEETEGYDYRGAVQAIADSAGIYAHVGEVPEERLPGCTAAIREHMALLIALREFHVAYLWALRPAEGE